LAHAICETLNNHQLLLADESMLKLFGQVSIQPVVAEVLPEAVINCGVFV